MKKSIFTMVIAVALMFAACQKDNMMNNKFNVDTQKYETQLNQDYTQANQFHMALITTKNSGTNTSTTTDTLYNKMMYNKNDSLFSEHFFSFCIDMMQNSGMMSDTGGMMGNNSNMMGSGGMMNGGTMGNTQDMDKMMNFMDSLYTTSQNMMNHDYLNTDSLLHNQMNMCNMMTTETEGVENIYNKMQTLRKDHQMMP